MIRSPIAELQARGIIRDCTNLSELDAHLSTASRTLYVGIDPTASSLHIGSLVPLVILKHFQNAGHTPIALIGGGTGLIGDPSFKKDARSLNTGDQVALWVKALSSQVNQLLNHEQADQNAPNIQIVNNFDWISQISLVDFLRKIASYFSVNQMINRESVVRRLQQAESGISLAELSYMTLQALDFLELNQHSDCTLQIGGSDQWGNIVSGIDLIQRRLKKTVFGLTAPLITQADGTKFGKTEQGTLWLDAQQTSAYRFYQFWRNVSDDNAYDYLRYFTFLSLDEISEIQHQDQQRGGPLQAQTRLAQAVTAWVHGPAAVQLVESLTQAVRAGQLSSLSQETLHQMVALGVESAQVDSPTVSLLDALVSTGLAQTNTGQVTLGQAKKLIKARSIQINGHCVSDDQAVLKQSEALHGYCHVIVRGKREVRFLVHNKEVEISA